MFHLEPPSPDQQLLIRQALNEDVNTRDRDLEAIKEWLKKEPHLPDTWGTNIYFIKNNYKEFSLIVFRWYDAYEFSAKLQFLVGKNQEEIRQIFHCEGSCSWIFYRLWCCKPWNAENSRCGVSVNFFRTLVDDGEYECEVCNANLFVSMVSAHL